MSERQEWKKRAKRRFTQVCKELLPKEYKKVKPMTYKKPGEKLSYIIMIVGKKGTYDRDQIYAGWVFEEFGKIDPLVYDGRRKAFRLGKQEEDEETALNEIREMTKKALHEFETKYASRRHIYDLEQAGELYPIYAYASSNIRQDLYRGRLATEFGHIEVARESLKKVADHDPEGICWREDLQKKGQRLLDELESVGEN